MAKINNKKVLILGSSGMLGSMVSNYLITNPRLNVNCTQRKENFNTIIFDAENPDFEVINSNYDYIVNCIGLIKPLINDFNRDDIKKAIKINSLFPTLLSENFSNKKTKIIQIATDCVYSGNKGQYSETDKHDALDVYGKTKSLGEVNAENFYNIRCSIIGPEYNKKISLLEWFLKQETKSELNGYTNHFWNGVTTLHFAKLLETIIIEDIELPNTIHFLPRNIVSKYDLLKIFSKVHNKPHTINKSETEPGINRTLATEKTELTNMLWKKMGYEDVPTIEQMVEELSEFSNKK